MRAGTYRHQAHEAEGCRGGTGQTAGGAGGSGKGGKHAPNDKNRGTHQRAYARARKMRHISINPLPERAAEMLRPERGARPTVGWSAREATRRII